MSKIDLLTHARIYVTLLVCALVTAYLYICIAQARTGIKTRPAMGISLMAIGAVTLLTTGTAFTLEFVEWLKHGTGCYEPLANLIWTVPSILLVYTGWRLLRGRHKDAGE